MHRGSFCRFSRAGCGRTRGGHPVRSARAHLGAHLEAYRRQHRRCHGASDFSRNHRGGRVGPTGTNATTDRRTTCGDVQHIEK